MGSGFKEGMLPSGVKPKGNKEKMDNEKKRKAEDQFAEFASLVVRHLPRGVASEVLQHWIQKPFERLKPRLAMLATIPDWYMLFGGQMRVWDSDFNEKLYPLVGSDDNTKAEEFGFDRTISGHEAVQEFERMKRKDASLWAQGRYINDNPNAQTKHPLVGTGARRRIPRRSGLWFPVFDVCVDEPDVRLFRLESHFGPYYRFLLQVED